MKTYRIVIADPSPIVLNGLECMLKDLVEYDVVFKTDDLHTLSSRLHVANPDVLIFNPRMMDYSKRMMVRHIFEDMPDMKLVALVSAFCDMQQLKQYHGVIEITDDIHRINTILNMVLDSEGKKEDDGESAQLSDREKEVLVCMAKGKKNSEIADALNISVHTVITHRKNIVRKTGIKSVAALTVYAILNNLIDEKDIL
ncbi:MAG: response regulator transcription factor [Bacteroidales bacterium]|nr:response regulator transcription factor [Bacteroidales bacterium]